MPDEKTPPADPAQVLVMPLPDDGTKQPIEHWAKELEVADWKFSAMKAGRKLDPEAQMTRAEFEKAIEEAGTFTIRGT